MVSIGDILGYWSNDGVVGTPHRVLSIAGGDIRIAIVMDANYEALGEPLENCVKEGKNKL